MHAYSTRNRREGFALAVAILAIVVIGGLIAGVFFATTEQFRMGRNQQLQTRAMAAAEYGQNRAIVSGPIGQGWNAAISNMAMGGVDSSISLTTPDGGRADVRVTRIGNASYLVASQGTAGSSTRSRARRRTSLLVSVVSPQINMLGALTTQGSTKLGGSSYIDGTDSTPFSGWSCPNTTPTALAGIAIADSTQIQTSGCGGLSCVAGSPKIQQNPLAADTTTYFDFGNGITWSTLVAQANKSVSGTITGVAPSTVGGTCNTSIISNWGDPSRGGTPTPCRSYFPIIYAPGDLNISGGVGQGILLVNGALKVTGGFQFYGPVIVRGDLDTSGTGGHFNGGVMAANVNLAQNAILGNAVVTYSSCVLAEVMNGLAQPRPLAERPWAELF
ncbi:MAG: pilus assembly PilX N-terminal domain-containing protein [Gemmatimonadaceae bacterium]